MTTSKQNTIALGQCRINFDVQPPREGSCCQRQTRPGIAAPRRGASQTSRAARCRRELPQKRVPARSASDLALRHADDQRQIPALPFRWRRLVPGSRNERVRRYGKRVDCRPSRDSRSHARLFRCKHRSWGSSYGRFVAGLADCREALSQKDLRTKNPANCKLAGPFVTLP